MTTGASMTRVTSTNGTTINEKTRRTEATEPCPRPHGACPASGRQAKGKLTGGRQGRRTAPAFHTEPHAGCARCARLMPAALCAAAPERRQERADAHSSPASLTPQAWPAAPRRVHWPPVPAGATAPRLADQHPQPTPPPSRGAPFELRLGQVGLGCSRLGLAAQGFRQSAYIVQTA
ncbi:unnamed protein product [Prorocentrum cordatum]|uniref:Uncharacterized protein n=1 Tax=Prorocentrum cordatum TaxID=2364126 RepID=A0ABN9VWX3_9DINO|nr:unnamed protein product [Polarella glacialis]